MTASLAVVAANGGDEVAETLSVPGDDMRAFFAAVATLQRETVLRFEETVGRLTGLAMIGAGRNDRDLIMTLQDFDRLQQEFAALGDMLARFGTAVDGLFSSRDVSNRLDRDVIAGISISDLKERLLRHYRSEPAERDPATVLDEAVF